MFQRISIQFFFVLIIFNLALSCQIVIRIDNIQDNYMVEQQIDVIDQFLSANMPISVGIIANNFGNDSNIVSYIQNVTTNYSVEPCSHWNNITVSSYDLLEQETMLQNFSEQIKSILGISQVVTFIPPYDVFDNTTLTAMLATGYTTISSSYGLDPGPFANNQPIYHYPATASTTDWYNITIGVNATTTISQLQQGLEIYGFGVIMVQPELYLIDSSWLSQLNLLISMLPNLGCEISLFREMNSLGTTSPIETTSSSSNLSTSTSTSGSTETSISGSTGSSSSGSTGSSTSGSTGSSTSGSTGSSTSGSTKICQHHLK